MYRVFVVAQSEYGFRTHEQLEEFESRVRAVANTMGIPYLIVPYGFKAGIVSDRKSESTGDLEPIQS